MTRQTSWRGGLSLASTLITSFLVQGCDKSAPATVAPPPPIVTAARPIVREVTDFEEFTGRVQAIESVDVRARVWGYLEKIYFEPGAEVKKDEVLFLIDPKPFKAVFDQAKAQLAQAQAALKEQEIEVTRLTELLKSQSASPIEHDRAVAQRDAAKAAVEAAQANVEQAQLNLDWTTVRSPINGRISRNYVDVGNLVIGGQMANMTLLTTIVAMDPIYAYFNVDEQTVLKVRQRILQGQMQNYKEASIPVWLGLANEENFPHLGHIDFVENRLDPDTGTLNVRAIFDNKGGMVRMLSPGLFTRVRLQVGVPYRAVLVPESALGSDQGKRFVLVVNDKRMIESRPVKIGRQQGDLRVIQQGLSPDEWIVTNGMQRVRPGIIVESRQTSIETQPASMMEPASQPQRRTETQSE